MKNDEILKKAIDKARDGGWNSSHNIHINVSTSERDPKRIIIEGHSPIDFRCFDAETIIFSHDFAKAFWPDRLIPCHCDLGMDCAVGVVREWQWHLQQMVLEENPIQYLAQFL